MLFAVDVGNSHTVSGIFDKGKLVGSWRMQSRHDRTADELAIRYHGLFQMAGIAPERITGFIVASVVPCQPPTNEFNSSTTAMKPASVRCPTISDTTVAARRR